MAQLLLAGTNLTASPSLEQALELVEARLANWATSSNSGAYNALLLQTFGAQSSETTTAIQSSISGTGLGISLKILPASSMNGLVAAYTSDAPGGRGERIDLNSAWLQSAKAEQIEAVLLEKLGHAIAQRLHGGSGTPGVDGAIVSALLRDPTSDHPAYLQNAKSVISHAGNSLLTEPGTSISIGGVPTGPLVAARIGNRQNSTEPPAWCMGC